MLRAAAAAVRNNGDDTAGELLAAAAAAATRVSGARPVRTPAPATVGTFCATTVVMKQVESCVISGDTGRALVLAEEVRPNDRPTSNNRNRHLLDLAYAQADNRRFAEATETLLRIRRDAPAWLSHQRYAQDIVTTLVSARRRAMTVELSTLADAVGLQL
ncbi:hypothetical protein [Micromonospora sp. NPDC049679]|uniref:hypothetical protein n=1 Tax=Micromonospora sp. NPDC049679 TaxID=3155920 RepID=UPI0033F3BFFF